jgi:protein-arginine kinase activator protein McsA
MSATDLRVKLQELAQAKQKAIQDGNIEKAAIIRDIEKEVQKELDELERNNPEK